MAGVGSRFHSDPYEFTFVLSNEANHRRQRFSEVFQGKDARRMVSAVLKIYRVNGLNSAKPIKLLILYLYIVLCEASILPQMFQQKPIFN